MTHYQIIIAEERRTQPERMAQVITSNETVVQLHSFTAESLQRKVSRLVGMAPNPAPFNYSEWADEYETEAEARAEYDKGVPVYEYDTLPPDFSASQFIMVAEWDGTSPYVIQHKGDYSARNMGYAGWPDLTHEQWVSQQADQMGVS